ncbi:MAG TPA: bifunctional UDP-N-acetylglucosamine diphosphorylase/glucosamine-1-phosphate N-acetyltransferase GlmU [Jatrophihabitantaceae bacterium]
MSCLAVVVLAAGEGTRMKSATLPKVLHGFAGRSLLAHVLAATDDLGAKHTVVVIGHRRDAVREHLATIAPDAVPVVQDEQRGTGHAVRLALEAVPAGDEGTIVVVPGDAPLLTAPTLEALLAEHTAARAAATVLSSIADDPTGYGRVIRDSAGAVVRVVEHKDATPAERAVTEVAASVYAFDHGLLRDAVGRLSTANSQGEEYLPEVVSILVADGRAVRAVIAPHDETAGVNDRVQLAAAHRTYNARLLDAHMRAGVTVVDPATTWVDADVRLEPDAVLLPSVDLHGATTVASDAVIGPQTTLFDTTVGERSEVHRAVCRSSTIGKDVTIGPFAYLRPGVVLADGVHIGTYVELKASEVGPGTKVPHLTYVGDATIGEKANIGAATVFVNYDGVAKHHTTVGDHVRIGSDTMLIAPITIGDGAYTAAGSVIDEDVPPGALGVARSRQRNVAGWVARKRPGSAAADAADRAGGGDTTQSDTDREDPE